MSTENQVQRRLLEIEQTMKAAGLWQAAPPDAAAFNSTEPFSVDTMRAEQWLQWVFLPRMQALLAQQAALPTRFALTPYFEMAFTGQESVPHGLLAALQRLDDLLNQEA
ncbi:hypothetical protein CYR40_08745 [Chimaeribacter arupi]|uniref:YqcC family protein n=1 Tax=Chimaeribacter arupi TaxID=2060066 RepID=UPI000C7E0CC8|nr:YqcC family protein [Chimaeribacter arupi]MDV5141330.1 YqcC family protein [Chimaeribacter arupi]PLR47216.1 hypothetical protein CYR40_08745 [Chimaeribacter arupi]